MKKRLLATLLALCMVLSLLPGTALAGETGGGEEPNGSTEETNGPTEETLSGKCGGSDDSAEWTYAGGTLTISKGGTIETIEKWCKADGAVIDTTELKTAKAIKFENATFTNTKIGANVFSEFTNLTEISIPDSITEIGEGAFSGCNKLEHVTLPATLTTMGANVFEKTNLVKAGPVSTTGSGDTPPKYNLEFAWTDKIPDNAFAGSALTAVTLPDTITRIGKHAFDGCSSLSQINFPEALTTIDDGAFNNCNSLKEIVLPEGFTELGKDAFSACSNLEKVTFPATGKTIGDNAFSDCSNLKEIVLPEGLTKLGSNAFQDSTLASVDYFGSTLQWKSINGSDQITAPITITCRKRDLIVSGGTVKIGNKYVTPGTYDKKVFYPVESGTRVTIMADSTLLNLVFTKWTVNSEKPITSFDPSSPNPTFEMPPNDVTISAGTTNAASEPTHKLTVIGGKINGGANVGDYQERAVVEIEATIPEGQIFRRWESSVKEGEIADDEQRVTTFMMPGKDVEINALTATQTYSVTVIDGTGNNNYTPGAKVTITAPETRKDPETQNDQVFDKWIVSEGGKVDFADANSASTTFEMPEFNVTVKPTYKDAPLSGSCGEGAKWGYDPSTKTLIVSGSGTIPAIADWLDENGIALNLSPKLQAKLKEATRIEFGSGINAIGDGAFSGFTALTKINIPDSITEIGTDAFKDGTARTEVSYAGSKSKWESVKGNDQIPASAKITCGKYDLTVTGGSGSGSYAAGAEVEISVTTTEVPKDKAFEKWTVTPDGTSLGESFEATSSSTKVTMPSADAAVTANYTDKTYTLKVENGTISADSDTAVTEGKYASGTKVTITANKPADGKVLDTWKAVTDGDLGTVT